MHGHRGTGPPDPGVGGPAAKSLTAPAPGNTATDYEGHAHAVAAVRACLGRGPTLMVRAGAPIGSVHSRPPPAGSALEAVRSL
ncbi:hypothetical protein GZL_05428 [Streptomyces sp. 769]|nr:hypothetical protein GZL_05428 [Streptomyces sp. 769]